MVILKSEYHSKKVSDYFWKYAGNPCQKEVKKRIRNRRNSWKRDKECMIIARVKCWTSGSETNTFSPVLFALFYKNKDKWYCKESSSFFANLNVWSAVIVYYLRMVHNYPVTLDLCFLKILQHRLNIFFIVSVFILQRFWI